MKHRGFGLDHFYVYAGSNVNLKNDRENPLYNLILVSSRSQKEILSVKKLPGGQSLSLGFDHEGTYLLYYSFGPGEPGFVDKHVLIDVIPMKLL